jgi:hypothetical protein
MKKILCPLVIILAAMTMPAHAQVKLTQGATAQKMPGHENAAFALYPTQNMWNFIKLDTRNGQMWQVQFDVKDNNRSVTYLNSVSLVSKQDEVNDRFTLYPTQNTFNFILLDQLDGRTWQVQWSFEAANRVIIPIE